VGIALIQDGNRNLLRLEGEINIAVAAELKASLLEAMRSGREICVSLGSASALDVTAFQLLWAAQREVRRAGLQFALTGSESIQHSLECMGLGGLLGAQDE
jgi:anti-anti-sigma factor